MKTQNKLGYCEATVFAVIVFILAILPAPFSQAQIVLPPSAGPLLLQLNPANPQSGSRIQVSVSSLTFDLDTATISWFVDNIQYAEDIGLTEINVQLNVAGATTIVAIATYDDTVIGSAEVRVLPAELDILWESDSYIPPLFEGRSLAAPDSMIRAEARARLKDSEGNLVSPQNITYTWKRNNALVKTASGKGKYKASFPAPSLFGKDTISVEASISGGASVSESVLIPSTDTSVSLYQEHPLLGILYHAALGEKTSLADIETSVVAIPFFAPNIYSPADNQLTYAWRVNGKSVETDAKAPNRLTINAENSSGEARLNVLVSHLTHWLMNAEGTWDIMLNAGFGDIFKDSLAPGTSL